MENEFYVYILLYVPLIEENFDEGARNRKVPRSYINKNRQDSRDGCSVQ